MAGWTSIIESGTHVNTPQGHGEVIRVSEAQQSAQVDIDGQLFEIPLEELTKGDAPDATPEGDSNEVFKVGQPIENRIDGGKGTVTDVTQRSVKVKYEGSSNEVSYLKREAYKHIKRDGQAPTPEKPETQPETQPEQKPEGEKPESETPETPQEIPEQKKTEIGDGLYDLFKIKEYLENKVETSVDGELKELRLQVKSTRKLEVKVGDKVNVVEGLKHKQLEQLITYASMRLSPLLVGMAGTGKTHAGEQTASALGLDFYAMSVGAQTSKSDIIGYMSATGDYVKTHFRDAYEQGGVFLMDEIDAGNANVLIQINSALSNGLCAFPDKMVKRHEDFVFVASANTFGNGANRQYVGRNQLDAATLDRFALINWFIDDELESNLTTGLNGKAWYMAVRACRDYVAEKNIRALISPRATQKGSKLLHVGQDLDEVIEATLLGSVPEDKKPDVTEVAKKIFNKFASEVRSELPKSVNPEVSELVR